MTVGERNAAKPNKTILLLGETGAGKSTLINALLNYSMGVKWEEEVWFQIKEEEENQTESPTSDVIVYEIFGYENETLPYSLSIIDTPEVGGPRGDVVIKRLFKLFQSEDGVGEVHAVGLVTKATGNHLSDQLMDIVYFLIARFGKGLEKNIMALVTHSDGRMPENVLKALEAEEMNFPRNEKKELVHFLFNNQQDKERTQRNEAGLKAAWSITETGMSQLGALMEETAEEVTKEPIRSLHLRPAKTCDQHF